MPRPVEQTKAAASSGETHSSETRHGALSVEAAGAVSLSRPDDIASGRPPKRKPSTQSSPINGNEPPPKRSKQLKGHDSSCKQSSSCGPGNTKLSGATRTGHTGAALYPRKYPDFWLNSDRVAPHRLHPTFILPTDRSHGVLAILTRLPLPKLGDVRLFVQGVPATVQLILGRPFTPDEEQVRTIHRYTLRLYRALLSKPFGCSLEEMPYFLVPMGSVQADELQRMDVASRVQWDQVHLAANAWAVPLNLTSVEALGHDVEDAVVQDKSAEFCRRYEVERLRTDMSPLSSPGDSKREAGFASFLEYCKVQSTRAAESITDYNQPLLQVTRLGGSVNFLNPLLSGPDESHKADAKYLIPQLCPKFSIPASIFKTGLYLPSLARRIDEMLLVKELNAEILHDLVGEQLLLEAITPPSASAEFNYERLELLGDAFLKYLASVYVYVTRQGGEGALHNARQKLIANDYLMDCAVRVGLPPYIQSAAFAYKYWAPHNVRVLARPTDDMTCGPSQDANGEKSIEEPKKEDAGIPSKRKAKFDPNTSQWLGHKAIADVVEAIIGAAYLNGGSDNALQTVLDLGIDLSGISSWTDFRRLSASDPGHPQLVLPSQSVVELSRILGRPVNDRQLLAHALACGGLTGAVPILRQRLEFLGDAILEYLLIRYLYSKNQSSSPGILSVLKAGMVSNDALAALCVTSGIYEHLLVDRRSELYRTTQNYRKLILQRQQAENAAARAELRSPGQFWHDVPAPKVLSDAMEATLGALYVSDGFTADGTQIVFERLFKPFYDRHVTLQTLSHHPNKILAELLQKQGCQDFEFRKADEHEATLLAHGRSDNAIAVCTVIVHGVILAVGEGESIAAATRAASLQALDAVEGDPGFIFRNCRCKARGQAKRGQSKKTKEKPLADVEGSSVRPSDS